MENQFKRYYRTGISELRPYVLNEDLLAVSVSDQDVLNGSPKIGDMIARNPDNHEDQWLVSKIYFSDNFSDDIILPIGYSVKISEGLYKGEIQKITDHIKFEDQIGYRLDNRDDAIYLMEDFE